MKPLPRLDANNALDASFLIDMVLTGGIELLRTIEDSSEGFAFTTTTILDEIAVNKRELR